jgi:hypothetical protein
MAAYASALRNVALAGPTLFGQVINTAAQITASPFHTPATSILSCSLLR